MAGIDSSELHPEPWTTTIKQSDRLLASIASDGYSALLGLAIKEVVLALYASGKITTQSADRARLSAALRMWASILSIEQGEIVAPTLLAPAVPESNLPELPSEQARELLAQEERIRGVEVRGFVNVGDGEGSEKVLNYALINCRLIGGRICDINVVHSFSIDMSGVVGLDFTRIKAQELHANSVRVFGCVFERVRVAGDAQFREAVLRSVRFRECSLPGVDFSEAKLGVPLSDVTGLSNFDDLEPVLHGMGYDSGRGTHFIEVDLSGAKFTEARLDGVRFDRCDLSHCDLASASSVVGMHIGAGCKLSGARIFRAPTEGEQLITLDSSLIEELDADEREAYERLRKV
jgi:uncharacterized protein YjbI with pentapeptide repeats